MRKLKNKFVDKRQHLSSIGLNPEDVEAWYSKWDNLKNNSKWYCKFFLSFEQYTSLAAEAGLTIPDQIGKSSGSYCMGRIGDKGDYELGNCRFITQRQNQLERKLNGGSASSKRGATKFDRPDILSQSTKISKTYRVKSPSGEIFEGSNLKEFCKENGLNQGNMSRVCAGSLNQTKGWTGEYVEKA